MNTELVIKKEKYINAAASKVWSVLTDPVNIEKWLGTKTLSEWTPGSDITFSFNWEGKDYTDKGKIIRFEKEKVFSYSYWSVFSGLPDEPKNYSKIKFELLPTDNVTILKLTHSDFAAETMYQHSDNNWEETLNEIKKISEQIRQIFIDKFIITESAFEEFLVRMNNNREFIKKIAGFVQDKVYKSVDEQGNILIITVTEWEDEISLKQAKDLVNEEYKRINFNPSDFLLKLNIKMERGIYTKFSEE
jgi:uncharacterized protein YndB with AHSA1/START domain